MPIPAFRDDGWLPEGHHNATWEEIEAAFGGEPGSRRAALTARLLAWRDPLRAADVTGRLVLDGSFVSAREQPGDCDCLFVYDDSRGRVSDDPDTAALVDYAALKDQGLGDVFVFPLSMTRRFPALFHEDAFDYDKRTQQRKGVVEVEI